MTAIPAYPLQWPAGWKRTPRGLAKSANFGKKNRSRGWGTDRLTIADGVDRIRLELDRMGVRDDDLVISTNLELRLDGFPRSGQRDPADAGVAVYWRDGKETRCMAIDRYDRIADNLAAVAATLDAMRAIERHGGAEILNRAFSGFAQLAGPMDVRQWWEVLGLDPSARGAGVTGQYRVLRSQHHPDKGGDPSEFQAVQAAYDQACAEGYV